MPTDDYTGLLRSALQQKYQMIERDPRDEKWAEWHVHPATIEAIRAHEALKAGPGYPYGMIDTYPPYGPGEQTRIFSYPVRVDYSVPEGEIRLVCETDLDATIRHQRAAGQTINIMPPVTMPRWTEPKPQPPTLKGLIRHWRDKVARR